MNLLWIFPKAWQAVALSRVLPLSRLLMVLYIQGAQIVLQTARRVDIPIARLLLCLWVLIRPHLLQAIVLSLRGEDHPAMDYARGGLLQVWFAFFQTILSA